MENYELAVQSVKATLFDRVYREQGLVDIINRKLDGYSLEVQERLGKLFTKQKENIESVLGLLSEFEIKMGDILAQSEEIMSITNGSNKEVVQKVTENKDTENENVNVPESTPSVEVVSDGDAKVAVEETVTPDQTVSETQNTLTEGTIEMPAIAADNAVSDVSTDASTNNQVVVPDATASSEAGVSMSDQGVADANVSNESVVVPTVSENVTSDSQGVVPGGEQSTAEVPTTEVTPAVLPEIPVVSESTSTEIVVPAENVDTSSTEAVPNVSEQPVNDVVAPVTEVVQIPGQISALEDEQPVASSEFVLSPIDEGVAMSVPEVVTAGIAAADNQLQAIDNVKNEIVADLGLSPEQKDEALEKYTRITSGTVKAILVTKSQYEKLLSSRETQKALLNAKKSGQSVETPVADGSAATENTTAVPSTEVAVQSEVVPSAPLTPIPEANSVVPIAPVADSTPVVNINNPATVQADEQTLIANGLLAPTAQDKQKEMQTMIEQANELYKAGNTQEAQELFNKVSVMNKELQAGSQGQTLVKS